MVITSLENEQIKQFSKLKEKKYRDLTHTFLVEGEHLLIEAFRKGALEVLILEEGTVSEISCNKTLIVTKEIMRKLTDLDHPISMIGVCKKKESTISGTKILVADGIQDPGNLGTMIRSAKAFGIDSICLLENTVDLYNSKVLRATQGILFSIPIVRISFIEFLQYLKNNKIPLYATRVDHGEDLRKFDNQKRETFALVMGNEGNGVREEIMESCDMFLSIPMNREVESLNVGVATSILLYEFSRRD